MVDTWTDACSLKCIFATFLANSSTSLGHPYYAGERRRQDDEDSDDSNNSNDKVWDEDEDNEQ